MTGKEYLKSKGIWQQAMYFEDTFKESVNGYKLYELLEDYHKQKLIEPNKKNVTYSTPAGLQDWEP